MQSTIRAVMFDLDGTLIDSLADLADATNTALATLGCPTHPREAYRHFVGDGVRQLFQRVLPSGRLDLIEEGARLMRRHYEAHCFDLTRLYPGVEDLVTALSKRSYKLAVLSNKPDDFTSQMVRHYFPAHPFAVVRGHQHGSPLKPDPSTALQIAAQLEVSPADWLYLGDTNTDMCTARAAGMQAVGVLWGFRVREELLASGAQFLVTKPDEVLGLLSP